MSTVNHVSLSSKLEIFAHVELYTFSHKTNILAFKENFLRNRSYVCIQILHNIEYKLY